MAKNPENSDVETVRELKKTFVEQADSIVVLEQKYAMANKISQEHDFGEAEELFDTRQVSVVDADPNGESVWVEVYGAIWFCCEPPFV